jgi:hypothetical protein
MFFVLERCSFHLPYRFKLFSSQIHFIVSFSIVPRRGKKTVSFA